MDLDELIGAESPSQRYRFLARLAARVPTLKVIVHDDACHLRLMAESQQKRTAIATRLAQRRAHTSLTSTTPPATWDGGVLLSIACPVLRKMQLR